MKKRKIFILIIVLVVILFICLLIVKLTNKTYAVGVTLVDTVKNNWASGEHNIHYTNNHEYRYIGSEVNNYVLFNNDLYRIIGVFDANSHGVSGKELVKVIRNRVLGSFSLGVYNTTNTSGVYEGYKNDWGDNGTSSSINTKILLNQFFYNKTDYLPNYGYCKDWTYYYNGNKTGDCSDIIKYGISEEYRGYIENVTWYLKGYTNTNINKSQMYTCERSNQEVISNCSSGNNGEYSENITGKIGLMYVSDYLYASGYYSDDETATLDNYYFASNNWLYKGYEWTMTPISSKSTDMYRISGFGHLIQNAAGSSNAIRPTFYLKSSVYVTGGGGSFDNPYIIACDDCN